MFHQLKIYSIIMCLLVLSACSGGESKTTAQSSLNDESTNDQTIGGTVRGLSGALVLANGDGDPITLTTSGGFSFDQKLETGDNYDVSILSQPDNQECGVTFSNGQVGDSNVRNVEVLCSSPIEFNVVIDIPVTLVGAIVVGEQEEVTLIDSIVNFFIQSALAEPVLDATIQVLSINPDGTVAEIHTSTNAILNNGDYQVTLNSPPRVDLAFLVSSTSAELGQPLPEGIYSIAADTDVLIDIASTVAVDEILESITSFESLTTPEVSAVITSAQDVALAEPSEGQSLQAYIDTVAEPTIEPVIADEIVDIADIDRFTMEYLAGKTFYDVWYGSVDDANGNGLPGNNPGIEQLDFGTDGTLTITSLQTGRVKTISYQVSNGRVHEAGDDTQGSFVVCGGTDQYLKNHHVVNGEFDNTDLMFFNEADAQAYFATLTDSIPACESALLAPITDSLPAPITGSWLYSEGVGMRNVLTFIDSSRYIMIHEHADEAGEPGSQTAGSVEYGNYTWNDTNNDFSVSLISESDGWGGLYDDGSTANSAQVESDSLSFGFTDGQNIQFSRIVDSSNSLVGAWLIDDTGGIAALTFLSGTEYVLAQTGVTEAYGSDLPLAESGEFGTYTLSGSVFSREASVDTDGGAGFYNAFSGPGGNTSDLVLQSSSDLLFDNGPGDQSVFTRVGN